MRCGEGRVARAGDGMNLAWLHSFRRVAEMHSYTRAADSLYVTQPAISRQVRLLERYFGATLIAQVGRELQLTDAGRKVYQLACTVEREVGDVRESLEHLVSRSRGLVTIAGPPSPLANYVPRILRRFCARYPHVSVRTLCRFRHEVADAVRNGVADIGLQTAPFLHPSLVTPFHIDDRLVAVCAPDHPLAARGRIRPTDLEEFKVAQLALAAESRTLVDDWFAARGVHIVDRLELGTLDEIRVAALQNLAIGFLSRGRVAEELATGELVRLDLEGFDVAIRLYVFHRPEIGPPVSDLIAVMLQARAEAQAVAMLRATAGRRGDAEGGPAQSVRPIVRPSAAAPRPTVALTST
jgi:LysR family transcriptional regulator, low CO2-responsive transcriptional regulator